MTTETEETTRSIDDMGTESAPPPSELQPGDADSWSEVTVVAVPQSRRMQVAEVSRDTWHSR